MIDGAKRAFGALGFIGFLGALTFIFAGLIEIALGHGGESVPTAWTLEMVLSLGAFFIGALGWIALDVAGGY